MAISPPSEHTNPAKNSVPKEKISLWLYLAGLCVTLSGLYAVNYQAEHTNFGMLLGGLALLGYTISYGLRVRRIPLRAFQTPIMICLALLIFLSASTDKGLEWFLPTDALSERTRLLQLLFAWMAVLQSFTLATDASVLFTCVPSMTMIALVSTGDTSPEVANSFLVFIGAATFLMVHENYLRTRTAPVLGRSENSEKRLFGGQLQIAAFCVVSALVLANYVAIPIETVGRAFLVPASLSSFNTQQNKQNQNNTTNVQVGENDTKEVATGIATESDVILMRVRAERGLYWRGTTYNLYTGTGFRDTAGSVEKLKPNSVGDPARQNGENEMVSSEQLASMSGNSNLFRIPVSPLELTGDQMQGSSLCQQNVTITDGSFDTLYGGGNVEEVRLSFNSLQVRPSGQLIPTTRLIRSSEYQVTSRVADDDPVRLRKASARLDDIPGTIRSLYLQRDDQIPAGQRLKLLADQITKGLKNNYDKAKAIEDFIGQRCKYNLQTPAAPRNRDVVTYFLDESKMGYCDSFAAAMTMLCRYANIPARYASGFLTGDFREGVYIVRDRHKHVWTEVFFPKIGWVAFDATANATDISDHSAIGKKKTGSFLAWMTSNGWIPPMIATLCLGLLAYVLKTELFDRLGWKQRSGKGTGRELPAANAELLRYYTGVCHQLKRYGLTRQPSMTPDEYFALVHIRAVLAMPELVPPLETLTTLCNRFRYGPETATAEDVRLAQAAAGQIAGLLKKIPRKALVPAVQPTA